MWIWFDQTAKIFRRVGTSIQLFQSSSCTSWGRQLGWIGKHPGWMLQSKARWAERAVYEELTSGRVAGCLESNLEEDSRGGVLCEEGHLSSRWYWGILKHNLVKGIQQAEQWAGDHSRWQDGVLSLPLLLSNAAPLTSETSDGSYCRKREGQLVAR